LIRVHNIKEELAKKIVLEVFKFAILKYEKFFKENSKLKYVVLLESEIEPFYNKLISENNTQNSISENTEFSEKAKNLLNENSENVNSQILINDDILNSTQIPLIKENDKQIKEKKRKRVSEPKKQKKKRKICEYAKCTKNSIINCSYCKAH
jgi:hypothetical protein